LDGTTKYADANAAKALIKKYLLFSRKTKLKFSGFES